MDTSTQKAVVYILRGAQLFFSILVLGLAAGLLADIGTNWNRVTYSLVIAIFTLIYAAFIGLIMHASMAHTILPIIILIIESLFTLFWLVAFALVADTFGSFTCYSATWCKLGKALIPFTLFNWLLFTATLILFIVFTIVPLCKINGANSITKPATLSYGAVFPASVPKAENKEELPAEQNIGINTSDDEAREAKDTHTNNDSFENVEHPHEMDREGIAPRD
ncbi:predicted protein [Scheffersomyces stipitis CBS 6054]|uniref:MARVEL domain-containing protein n=1 Tax=Scheffersomyces stipitis (strain ATCC 58785 / CBS 6054 / NBRC 10063 / NRRL Y-11545) TaxID=322104 RepID=A3LNT6_PICST|nr:predicted protein [Scheffersomyces stipitis CBS 6054]ABN64384.1 predicted protein [Scheffersomyces stipitis CBS 6054]